MFAPQQNTVRLESNGILMTCIYNILILTPKGLTPDYAAGNRHRAFFRYQSITAPLSLLISLKAHGNYPKQCKL